MKKLFGIFLIFLTFILFSCELPAKNNSNPNGNTSDQDTSTPTPDLTPDNNDTDDSDFEDYGMSVITITITDISISESGIYSSMEEVGTYIFTYYKLPSNYKTKSEFKMSEYTPQNKLSVGGDRFYNREGLLPTKAGRTYTECDIDYRGGSRNAKRIVYSSDFLIFYTNDHYASFSILRFV